MYLPPDDLAVQFRNSAVLMAEYDELHRAYNPGFLRATLSHIGLRPKPNWGVLQRRVHALDRNIRKCVAAVEQHLVEMQREAGSVPAPVQLPYRLLIATANAILGLRAIVDTLEESATLGPEHYGARAMALQQHYREKRVEMDRAAAACRQMRMS